MVNPFEKEQKLFSIISPCYKNDWKHLSKVAESLAQQDYKKFEWIVVFDGKNAYGEKEMKKVKRKYPNLDISFYSITHSGAPAARNYGATKAKGEIYVFLDSDKYLYTETLRMWATAFENSEINRVWGTYDMIAQNGIQKGFGMAVTYPNGDVWYPSFKYSNYCDSTFPIRKSAFIKWDENCKSLQDWDWAVRQLKRDNFQGKDWKFINHSFFAAENVEEGGLSHDSHLNWIERTDYIRNKNGIPKSNICVVSLGAPHHAFHIADKLGADYLPMPSYKPHNYKAIYLIGFYTKEDPVNPITTRAHMSVFGDNKGKNIIHWIGSDIYQMRWNCCFEKIKAIKEWMKENKIINLTEFEPTYKEMKEIGIKTKIIPIPPKKLNLPISLPKEFSVAIYENETNKMYYEDLMPKIVEAMPDVKFYYFGDDSKKGQKGNNFEHLGYVNMDEWLPKFSANLRISVHDGLPLLPIEFITAGRQVITNVDLKGTIRANTDPKTIISGIRTAQKEQIDKKWIKYWKKELDFKKYKRRIYAASKCSNSNL